MDKKKIKKHLLKKKLALLSALTIMGTTKVEAGIGFNIIVTGEPEYAQELIDDFNNKLPLGLQQFIIDYNTIILLEDDEEADEIFEYYNGFEWPDSLNGFTEATDNKYEIFVEACKQGNCSYKYHEYSDILTEDEFYYRIAREAFFHELGHAIDGDYFEISTSEEFTEIYYLENDIFVLTESFYIDNLQNKDNIGDPIEYFATAFSAYVNHPEDLFIRCPRTYQFIDEYVKRLSEYYDKSITI